MKTPIINGKEVGVVLLTEDNAPAIEAILDYAVDAYKDSPDLSYFTARGYSDEEIRMEFRDFSWSDGSCFGVKFFLISPHSEHECTPINKNSWVYWSKPTERSTRAWWIGYGETTRLRAVTQARKDAQKVESLKATLIQLYSEGKLFVNDGTIHKLGIK